MQRIKRIVTALALTLLIGSAAWSLDAADIVQLMRSGVNDAVIINLVRSNKFPAPLTPNEVMLLNSNGASPTLLGFLTSPEASYGTTPPPSSTVTVAPQTYYPEVEVGTTDTNTYYLDENGNYIAVSPEYAGSTGTYYYDNDVDYYTGYTYPGTTYYYDYDDYGYDYSYPTYPTYGGLFFGGGSHRPDRRPPPPSSHRPGRPGHDRPRPPSGTGHGGSRPGGGGGGSRPPGDRPRPPSNKPKPPSGKPKPPSGKPKPDQPRPSKPPRP